MAQALPVLLLTISIFAGLAETSTTETQAAPTVREIWALEARYMKLFENGDLDGMATFYHPDFLGWPSHSPAPVGPVEGRASVEKLLQTLEITELELEPRAIHIEGGVALVHYVVIMTTVGEGGKREETAFRLTHTWIEENEQWKILGGMSARIEAER